MTFKETLESKGFVRTSEDDCYTKNGQRVWLECDNQGARLTYPAWLKCPIVFQEFKQSYWETVSRCHDEDSALVFLGEWI